MRTLIKTLTCLCLLAMPALAQEEQAAAPAPKIMVEQAYAFATMPGGETGAAFMVIKNAGDADDTLKKVKSSIAKRNEIHENAIDPDSGTMKMRKIDGIAVPAKGEAVLKPKGNHVMLMKLKEPLTLDSTFPLTLVFDKSGEVNVDVKVIQPGTTPDGEDDHETMHMDHEHMDHSDMHHEGMHDMGEEEDFPENSFSQGNRDF